MSLQCRAANLLPLVLLASLLFAGGCAVQPPNQNTLSGKRLIVDLTFAGPVDPAFHYFFLINKVGDLGQLDANGPIPVLVPPYGNGFATGPAGTQGFTDYVEFDNLQPNFFGLYHVLDWTTNRIVRVGAPVSYTPPVFNSDDISSTRLHFEIDLSQLFVDASGNPLTNQPSVIDQARNIKWVQINIITTNWLPTDASTVANKFVDSLGDTVHQVGITSWLQIDLSQLKVYQNSDFSSQPIYEPPNTSDVYPAPLDPIDLRDWRIEVRQE